MSCDLPSITLNIFLPISKLGLDGQLAPIIRTLEECYPRSACSVHPDIHCYQYSPQPIPQLKLSSIGVKSGE